MVAAMMLTWAVASSEAAYAKQDLYGSEPAMEQNFVGKQTPGIGTSPGGEKASASPDPVEKQDLL